ncbi:cupin domain-containing protein [Sphingobium sp.]|uniref:cupin domain-containing protein n=1 Tax=Sphingobium sp. TaxID=1912891 RepID=UPI002D80B6BD|nr:cupin domain-containing protein [Sphingobium sp.]
MLCLTVAMSNGVTAAAPPEVERTPLNRIDVNPSRPTEVVVSRLVVQPGGMVPPHTHPGVETAYVIAGSRTEIWKQGERDLQPGEMLTFPEGQVHGLKVVGKKPLILLTIHIVVKDEPMVRPAP